MRTLLWACRCHILPDSHIIAKDGGHRGVGERKWRREEGRGEVEGRREVEGMSWREGNRGRLGGCTLCLL